MSDNLKGICAFILAVVAFLCLISNQPYVFFLFSGIIVVIYLDDIKEIVGRIFRSEDTDLPSERSMTELTDTDINQTQYENSNYDRIEVVFHSLKNFLSKVSSNSGVRNFARKHIKGNIQIDGSIINDPGKRIELLLDLDIVYCYMKLGIPESDVDGLIVLQMFTDICDFNISTRKENPFFYFSELYHSREDNPDCLYLGHCLEKVNQDFYHEYCSLLLSFSQIMSELCSLYYSEETDSWINELKYECKTEADSEETEEWSDDMESDFEEEDVDEEDEDILTETDAIAELDSLIGLDSVKTQVHTLKNFVQVMQQRKEKGLKTAPVSFHCVFTGNPGTGKTTVARIVAQIYKEVGILKKGHLVETDRSGLVAEYIGQTAVKTNRIIDKALDGVLFIDEAYSLFVKDSSNDYGLEAITALLKRMEDDRDRLIVILAGYTNEMQDFMEANPGLKSRFNRYIEFPDYTVEDLSEIFIANVRKYQYKLSPDAERTAVEGFAEAVAHKDRHFGNGRYVRNLFEKIVECQANRISMEQNPDVRTLMDILPIDVSSAFSQINQKI